MKTGTLARLFHSFVLACAVAAAPAAQAAYPDKPIRMVIGWSAGGGTDVVARVVAKHLSKQLGVSVVVENRDGASGMIATEMVANATPDGYLIQYTVADTHSVNPHLIPNVRYDAIKDFGRGAVPRRHHGAAGPHLRAHPDVLRRLQLRAALPQDRSGEGARDHRRQAQPRRPIFRPSRKRACLATSPRPPSS